MFDYVQCDIKLPKKLWARFANFPPIFKNTLINKNDIGELLQTNAQK